MWCIYNLHCRTTQRDSLEKYSYTKSFFSFISIRCILYIFSEYYIATFFLPSSHINRIHISQMSCRKKKKKQTRFYFKAHTHYAAAAVHIFCGQKLIYIALPLYTHTHTPAVSHYIFIASRVHFERIFFPHPNSRCRCRRNPFSAWGQYMCNCIGTTIIYIRGVNAEQHAIVSHTDQ